MKIKHSKQIYYRFYFMEAEKIIVDIISYSMAELFYNIVWKNMERAEYDVKREIYAS